MFKSHSNKESEVHGSVKIKMDLVCQVARHITARSHVASHAIFTRKYACVTRQNRPHTISIHIQGVVRTPPYKSVFLTLP